MSYEMRNPISTWYRIGRWCSLTVLCGLLLSCTSSIATTDDIEAVDIPEQETSAVLQPNANLSTDVIAEANSTPSTANDTRSLSGPGQILPITAQAIMAGTQINLEVARTREQQSLGLMYRTELADDRGMLFPFEFPRRASFWMKNVPISLDMVFLLDGKVQDIAENVPPCESDPCPVYGPGALLVDQVIELRGGRAMELGLQPGDEVSVIALEDDET